VITFNVPAGPMQASLVALARQADIKILFESDLVAALRPRPAGAVHGA
jgi:hypothetical protein